MTRHIWLPVLFTIIAGGSSVEAQTEYFPLDRGNVWIYRSDRDVRTVEAGSYRVFGDQAYFSVTGMPDSDEWLRLAGDGTLYGYDEESRSERVVARFGASEGDSYEAFAGPCSARATIASRKTNYKGPIGQFDNALEIRYTESACRDAGITREVYLPWVGLVERTETTIAGPRTYQLIYARLGGVTVISSSELAFQLTLDRPVYVVNRMPPVDPATEAPAMTVRMALRHSAAEPLPLTFSSGQTYEIVLRDSTGKEIWRWSDGKAFTQALRTVAIPSGEKNWTEQVRLAGADGRPLPEGKYIVEAWLVTQGPRMFSATVPLEIRYIY